MRVTVLGLGYVGAVAAAALAHDGHDVLGVDIDRGKVERFRRGEVPFHEHGLDELVREGLKRGNLRFAVTGDVGPGDLGELVFVAVGTPSLPSGAADLSQVEAAMAWLTGLVQGASGLVGDAADRPGHRPVVVMKSTVPPGTGRRLRERYLAAHGIAYVSNPEFLREGSA
ncbi:MAG TPA: UDP-glucose/GDP-mannose dehydrogenase family protein, partial [Thermaerobacter sp.]